MSVPRVTRRFLVRLRPGPRSRPFAAVSLCLTLALLPGVVAAGAPALGAPAAGAPAVVDGSWRPVGPSQQGGRTARSAADPWAAVLWQSDGPGLWHTVDGGRTWRQVVTVPVPLGTAHRDVVLDPLDAGHWWYASDVGAGRSESAVWETHDAGATWNEVLRTPDQVHDLLLGADGTVLVSVTGGEAPSDPATTVRRSRDGGRTWSSTAVPARTQGVQVAGDALLFWSSSGVHRAEGLTADQLAPVEAVLDVGDDPHVEQLALFSAHGDLAVGSVLGRGVVGSSDGGRTWSTWLTSDEARIVTSVDVSADDVLVRGSDETFVSGDGGASFRALHLPEEQSAHQRLDRWPDGSLTVTSPRSGVWRSADGAGDDWTRTGVAGGTVHDLVVDDGRLLAATDQGLAVGRLPLVDAEWADPADAGLQGVGTNLLRRVGGVLWRSVQLAQGGFSLQRSPDGVAWSEVLTADGAVTALAGDPDGFLVLASRTLTVCLVRTSADGGATWDEDEGPCLDDAAVHAGAVWGVGRDGLVRTSTALDGWTVVRTAPASALLVDRGRLFVGGHGVEVRDAGTGQVVTAEASPPGLDDAGRITTLLRVGPRVLAGVADDRLDTGPGVLASGDDGASWYDATGDLVDTEVLSLAASPDRRTLWAGTALGGVHELALPAPVLPTALDDDVQVPHGGSATVDVLADDTGGDAALDPTTLGLAPGDGASDPAVTPTRQLVVDGLRFDVGGDGTVTVADESGAGPRTTIVEYTVRTLLGDEAGARLVVTVPGAGPGAGGAEGDAGASEGEDPQDAVGGSTDAGAPGRALGRLAFTGGLGSLAGVLGLGALLALAGAVGLVAERGLRRRDDGR